jgi:L-threonylcarbamoyladenylate synthase
MRAFWPGPLTLIVPRRAGVATASAGGQDTIGLRCPSHPVALALLRACAAATPPVHGLSGPSANRFGRVSPTTAAHVQAEFGDSLLVLDGGPCDVGIESTIIDCTRGVPVLLRPGAITRDQVAAACGQPVRSQQELDAADARRAACVWHAGGALRAHCPRAADGRRRAADGAGPAGRRRRGHCHLVARCPAVALIRHRAPPHAG